MAGLVSGPADAATPCHTPWGSLSKQAPRTYVDASATSEGQNAHLTGVRSARHRCFDRLVLDFDGPKANDFEVGYVYEIPVDASGYMVPQAGSAFLQIGVMAPAYDAAYAPTYYATDLGRLLPVAGYRAFRG